MRAHNGGGYRKRFWCKISIGYKIWAALAAFSTLSGSHFQLLNLFAPEPPPLRYAQSHLSRTKNDRVDAALIAGFCAERRPPAWYPPAPELRQLQALVRRLEALIEMRTAEQNRLSSGSAVEAVRASVEEVIAHLSEQIKKTEVLIRSVRQVAALTGLVPRQRQSGSSVRGRVRLSKSGNARLRKALYFPAVTALRCSPFFQQWAEGLRARGKSKLAVIGAAMRKLIHLAYGVLKTGRPFDPQWAQKAKNA